MSRLPIEMKRGFMIDYVLRRADTALNLDGRVAAQQAEIAWSEIEAKCQPEGKERPTLRAGIPLTDEEITKLETSGSVSRTENGRVYSIMRIKDTDKQKVSPTIKSSDGQSFPSGL